MFVARQGRLMVETVRVFNGLRAGAVTLEEHRRRVWELEDQGLDCLIGAKERALAIAHIQRLSRGGAAETTADS